MRERGERREERERERERKREEGIPNQVTILFR